MVYNSYGGLKMEEISRRERKKLKLNLKYYVQQDTCLRKRDMMRYLLKI
jgi:hypothetical protein